MRARPGRGPRAIAILAPHDGTTVTTNLPPPHDRIAVNAREEKTFMASRGFTLSADEAVQVAQHLVPQHFVKQGDLGDPSQLTIPAAERHRKDHVFVVPATWTKNDADHEQVTCPSPRGVTRRPATSHSGYRCSATTL